MAHTMGERIKELRDEREWTQQDLADRVGVHFSLIYRWETDKIRSIKDSNMKKLAEVFGVSESYIRYGYSYNEKLPEPVEKWLHDPKNSDKVIRFVLEEQTKELRDSYGIDMREPRERN